MLPTFYSTLVSSYVVWSYAKLKRPRNARSSRKLLLANHLFLPQVVIVASDMLQSDVTPRHASSSRKLSLVRVTLV